MRKLFLKIWRWLTGNHEIIETQRLLIEGLQKQIETLKETNEEAVKYPVYTLVPLPGKNEAAEMNRFFAGLGSDRFFQYYLFVTENNIMLDFYKGGKPEDFHRGRLDMLQNIRAYIMRATDAVAMERANGKV